MPRRFYVLLTVPLELGHESFPGRCTPPTLELGKAPLQAGASQSMSLEQQSLQHRGLGPEARPESRPRAAASDAVGVAPSSCGLNEFSQGRVPVGEPRL